MRTNRVHEIKGYLSDEEYQEFVKLCMAKGLGEEFLIRHAFIWYQMITVRLARGESMKWFTAEGEEIPPGPLGLATGGSGGFVMGCGPLDD